ncbi:MAG: glycosyltransferase [Hyphomonadaceae bacterium]
MSMTRLLSLAPLQIAQALIGFGAIAAFTRLMSPEDFGRYALALSISMAAHTIVFTWAEAAAFRFFAAARAEKRLADHFATLGALALGLGAGVLVMTAATLAVFGLHDQIAAISAFAAGAAVLRFITRIARESDRAALDFTRYATLETLYVVVGFAGGIACLMTLDLGAAAPFSGLLLAGVMVALIDAPRLFANAKGGTPDLPRAKDYAAYGAPLALALAIDLGVQALTRIVLVAAAGAASMGAYAAAFGLARPLDLLFMGLSAAFAPLVFATYEDKGPDAAREIAGNAFVTLAAIVLPACVGLILVAQPLADIMVGQALRAETVQALPWLAVAGLFSGFTLYYWSEAFQLTRRTGLRAALIAAPGVFQILLTLWFAPTQGAVGAAMAAAISACIGFVLLGWVGRNLIALPMPMGALARIGAATLAMAVAVLAMPDALGLVAKVTAGGAAYALAAIALDIFGLRVRASAVWSALMRRERAIAAAPTQIDHPVLALTTPNERIVSIGAGAAAPRLSVLTPFYRYDPSDLLARFAHVPNDVEFVLLDDGSASAELLSSVMRAAEKLGAPVRIVVWEENRGRSMARNRLIAEARGDYVLFLDADMAPDDTHFLSIWRGIIHTQRPDVAFGGLSLARARSTPETAFHYSLFERSDCQPPARRMRRPAQSTASANLLVRREFLERFPFDHGFVGWGFEDTDWALRVAEHTEILHIENPATHVGLDSIDSLLRKSAEAGPNFGRLARKHPGKVTRFAAHRLARVLRRTPARRHLRKGLAWLARDPMGAAPMLVRRTAFKLYRITYYAEHLQ